MAGRRTCGSGAAACIAAGQARAFVDGALPPDERAEVERRLAACAACRAVLEAVRPAPDVTAPMRGPPAVTAPLRGSSRPPAALVDDRGDVIGSLRPAGQPAGPPRPDGKSEVKIDSALSPGELVGRYVVERPLGAGGMGVVSLARDPELRRPVVIKLVHPEMLAGENGDEFEARLRREAQAMAQVSHANVVQIFDIGRRGDRVFLAMEFVAGQTLDEWLRERRRSADEILGVILQAGAGLAAAHRAGLVHRDFKPSNVLVGRDGVVKVTDFGLARSLATAGQGGAGATHRMRAAERAPRPSGVHAVLTEVDAVVGTPAYMAPEQAAGAPIDARTDQYALAVTLLDALLAQSPSRRRVPPGEPAAAIDAALAAAGLAPAVRSAIVRGLAADPAARFASIDDLLVALVPPAAPAAVPPRKSRRGALVIAGVALCGLAAAAWWLVGRDEAPRCRSELPARWAGAARGKVVAALSPAARPFAGWEAERVAAAVDAAVRGLAFADAARCRRTPLPGPEGSAACIAQRTAALAALTAAAPSVLDDPWPAVHRIERCDPPDPAASELRGKLAGATTAQAIEIAAAAHKLGDEVLVADAHEAAGVAAMAAGDAAIAGDQFRAMAAAGLAADSAAAQGRALLHLIQVAAATGDHQVADQHRFALDALLERYHDAPRDVLAAALVEGAAFGDLGDVAIAFAAWDRAQAAATALGDPDALLAAAIGRARALDALRLDLDAARTAATAALAAAVAASPPARAAALRDAAALALEAGDARAARAALDEAGRLDPASAAVGAGRLLGLRSRALAGDVDAALAELTAAAPADPLAVARTQLARGQILLAADHASEAADVLDRAAAALRSGSGRAQLPLAERLELELAACDAHAQAGTDCKAYRISSLVAPLHPRAPVRARLEEIEAATTPPEQPAMRAFALRKALDIRVDAGTAPVRIAELRWQLARLCPAGTDCRSLATAAREAFAAAGRTGEVAEIDRWLVDAPATPSYLLRDAGVPDAPPRRELGPQP